MTSIPLYKTVLNIVRQLTGDDPEEIIEAIIPEDADMLRDMILYGVPSISGFTMGGSIGMELPVFERLSLKGPFVPALGNELLEALGIPWAILTDVGNAVSAYQSGQGLRAFEYLAPAGLGNIAKGIRLGTGGSYTLSGRPINVPGSEGAQKLSTTEMIGKMVGFQPTKLTKSWDVSQALEDFQTYKANKRSNLATRILNSRGNKVKLKKIQKELIEWNIEQSEEHPEYRISDQELLQSIVSRTKTRKPPAYMIGKTKQLRDRYFQEAAP